jgi:hypothetical protein
MTDTSRKRACLIWSYIRPVEPPNKGTRTAELDNRPCSYTRAPRTLQGNPKGQAVMRVTSIREASKPRRLLLCMSIRVLYGRLGGPLLAELCDHHVHNSNLRNSILLTMTKPDLVLARIGSTPPEWHPTLTKANSASFRSPAITTSPKKNLHSPLINCSPERTCASDWSATIRFG